MKYSGYRQESKLMNESLYQRRKFLGYLGLGVAGIGTALVLGKNSHTTAANGIVTNSLPPASTNALEIQAAASKTLPELSGINQWINSAPLTLASLRGNVVLIQFWTFGCINCQRTLPYIVQWHDRYATQGLKIVSIHCPEFAYERDLNNVQRAVQQHKIRYPVAIDNDFKTWKAYNNRYWPNLILADRQGVMQYDHAGEGAYDTTESTIRKLLG
jgi:thiol-disulfide isomerase/thioredoxin